MTVKSFRVYDDRTGKTIFESKDKWQAMEFLFSNFNEDHPDFNHVWIEDIHE